MTTSGSVSTLKLLSLLFFVLASSVDAQASPSEPQAASPTIDCKSLRFRKTGFWDIDIDNRPALPRECVAPFSRNADRNTDHLPYQIAAICGSYAASVLGVGLAILAIRRKRKLLLAHPYSSGVELKLVQNESRKFEKSPISPAASVASWMRNPLRRKASSGLSAQHAGPYGEISSPGLASIASFDNDYLDADKEKRQAEMDRLYAAVMVHDAARRSQRSQTQLSDTDTISQAPPAPRDFQRDATLPKLADRRLERVARLDVRPPPSPTNPGAPETPKLPVRAIYPPSYDISQVPLSPTSPIRATVPDDFWPQQGRQPRPIESKSQLSQRAAAPLSPTMPLSPTTPKIELPNDMYPASPPPGGRRMRLPNYAGRAFPLSPGGPVTPISAGPMSAAMFTNMMAEGPPRRDLPNDMYPASPPLQSHPMTLPPPINFDEPIRRPSSTRSFGSRMETESIASNRSGKGRRMMKNMRINTGVNLEVDSEERAPLSATFQKDTSDAAKESSSNSNTPDTPQSTELEDRFETMNSTVPPIPQTRLGTPPRIGTPPRRSTPKLHSLGPSLSSINTIRGHHNNAGAGAGPASPAMSQTSVRSVGLPSGPKSGVLPQTFTSHPRAQNRPLPPAIKLPPPPSSATSNFSQSQQQQTRSPASATAPGGSKPLALRVQFGDSDLRSPAAVKTTFLERRKEALGRGGLRTAKTPVTGIPQTPYSAYMPFTPMTPITPHLVSRQERKQRKKEMGRTVLQDTDMVKEEDEEWE